MSSHDSLRCPLCDGSGVVFDGSVDCATCNGSGRVAPADLEAEREDVAA